MAKHNYSRNIGFTFCSILSILLLMLLFFPNLMSIGHKVYNKRKDHNEIDPSNQVESKDVAKTEDLNELENNYWENINGMISDKHDEFNRQRSSSIDNKEVKYKVQQNYQYFDNIQESNKREPFKFNIKLNSFSKESTDLLD